MCLLCSTNAITVIENVLPGYHLEQATKSVPTWKAGEYGLTGGNDPDFIFPGELVADPTDGMSDDELDALDESDARWIQSREHFKYVESIEPRFNAGPMTGYRLVKACMDAGYDPERDGTRVLSWLVNHIAVKLQSKP